jgi:hypothetical protein
MTFLSVGVPHARKVNARMHDANTDGRVPADGIDAAAIKIGLRHVPMAARGPINVRVDSIQDWAGCGKRKRASVCSNPADLTSGAMAASGAGRRSLQCKSSTRTCRLRALVAPAAFLKFRCAAYLTRFHTNGMTGAAAPADGAGLVYLSSSPVTERLIRF